MDTANDRRSVGKKIKKGRVRSRPLGTFRTPQVSEEFTQKYQLLFGVVGAAGFGVVAGLVPAGLGAAVPAAGAGTPDCAL